MRGANWARATPLPTPGRCARHSLTGSPILDGIDESYAREGQVLGAALNFGPADLDANRAGRISPGQRARLRRHNVLRLAGAAACLVGGGAFNVALLTGWLIMPEKGALLAGVIAMLFGGAVAWSSWPLWVDLAAGRASPLDGELTTDAVHTRWGDSYYFLIDDAHMRVPFAAYDRVIKGPRRAYFLPRSNTLLSVEPPAPG